MLPGVTAADEAAAAEPSAAHRIISERFSVGPFRIPADDYYSGEKGSLFFAPNAWPEPDRSTHPSPNAALEDLRPVMVGGPIQVEFSVPIARKKPPGDPTLEP
jgi:hypothetical protein